MQTGLIRPRRLKPGDTLAAVSLSWGGPSVYPHRYHAGKRQLEEAFNVELIEMPHTLSDADWLQQNPQARAEDLMQAFADPAIDGIISTIGGDDSIRLLPYIDFDVIRNNPKVFMGYSDTTISHFICLKAGLGSFYGPAIMAGFGENGGLMPYMRRSVEHALFSADPLGEVFQNTGGWTVEHLDWAKPELQRQKRKLNPSTGWQFLQGEGLQEGHLIGGCIEVMDWLRGTPLWPTREIWEGAVLFLETSEEGPSPISIARILRAFAAAGLLKRINGILFGRPGGQVPVEKFDQYDQAILRIVAEEECLRNVPIVTRMDFGHTDPMMVLPYGLTCEIDCENQKIIFPECATT